MSGDDAFSSPFSPPQTMPTPEAASGSRLRWVVFLHVIAVMCCAGMSLASKGMLINREVADFYLYYGPILLVPALMAWFVCPVIVLLLLARKGTSGSTRLFAILAEGMLCVGQLLVLLPAFQ